MESKEELKGLITEIFQKELEKSKDEQAKAVEVLKTTEESKRKEIEKRIEAIESLPLKKMSLSIPGTDKKTDVYLGYKMDKQLVDIFTGQRCPKARDLLLTPKMFPIIADEEKRDKYARHLLMIVKASMGDFKAKQEYEDWRMKTTMSEGSATVGGYLVPDEYSNEVLAFARLNSFALNDCRIWPMSSDTLLVPREDTKVSVAWHAESASISHSNPTFGQVTLTAKRLDAYTVVTNELLQDAAIDLVSYLTEIFAEASGQELDNQVLNGTGDPVSGVLTAAAGKSVVMPSGSTAFSNLRADDLVNMIDQVDQEVEPGCRFYFHKNIMTYIRLFKDANGQFLFGPINGPIPNDLWSYPYTRTPKAPKASDTAVSKAFVSFGNMRYFLLGRRLQGMTLDVDPFGAFLTYETRFRIAHRWGLAIGKSGAFCRLITAAS